MSLSPRPALLLTLALALAGTGCATASQKEAAAPEAAPVVAMADKPAKQLHSGSFREAEKPVEGGFTIRREGERTLLMLSEDFSTSRTRPTSRSPSAVTPIRWRTASRRPTRSRRAPTR
ncbi:hypothetical protein [Cyanobium sp. LEGE 06113]|uniref:hypothetical protein n=1 Tax=Cyanobium sp. LEGE 06113 TaxID=1297573 RepID=UPI0021061D24|nr:hypothetical protein [Cyanobium sp. LEGE 06113]